MARKLALGAALALAAGCGGGGAPETQTLTGSGYRVEVPAGWRVEREGRVVSARDGGDLLSVTTFRLRRAYQPSDFGAVVPELDRVAREFAEHEGGRVVASRTLVVAGRRARQYDIDAAGTPEQVTFVLRGRREFQLFCRTKAEPCSRFVASFALR